MIATVPHTVGTLAARAYTATYGTPNVKAAVAAVLPGPGTVSRAAEAVIGGAVARAAEAVIGAATFTTTGIEK